MKLLRKFRKPPRSYNKVPLLIALLPFQRRIDISGDSISIDGKPLEERIRGKDKKKAYKYLIKRLGVKRYGISRFGLYKKLKRRGKTLLALRREALQKVEDKKLLEILLDIRIRGRFKTLIREKLKALERKRSLLKKLLKRLPKRLEISAEISGTLRGIG